ncbi:MAG: hypothetical protein CMLOHMNK_00306 [Steroidobacteraceae bacterium]|nr:hypothetical protein [Steroidobacteraceae bacterium]
MIAYSRSRLLLRERMEYDDGSFVEMVIWRVPVPVPGSIHEYKYRLFYGREGERLVGYDNERSKGDHRHVCGKEEPYPFRDVESLVQHFLVDVEVMRSK